MTLLHVLLGLLAWCVASVPIALALGWAMSRRGRSARAESARLFRSSFDTAA